MDKSIIIIIYVFISIVIYFTLSKYWDNKERKSPTIKPEKENKGKEISPNILSSKDLDIEEEDNSFNFHSDNQDDNLNEYEINNIYDKERAEDDSSNTKPMSLDDKLKSQNIDGIDGLKDIFQN